MYSVCYLDNFPSPVRRMAGADSTQKYIDEVWNIIKEFWILLLVFTRPFIDQTPNLSPKFRKTHFVFRISFNIG